MARYIPKKQAGQEGTQGIGQAAAPGLAALSRDKNGREQKGL